MTLLRFSKCILLLSVACSLNLFAKTFPVSEEANTDQSYNDLGYISPDQVVELVNELNHMRTSDFKNQKTVLSLIKRYNFDCTNKDYSTLKRFAHVTCVVTESSDANPGGWPAQVLGLEYGRIIAAIATQPQLQMPKQKQWFCRISKSEEKLPICVLRAASAKQKRFWYQTWSPFFDKNVG